MSADNQIVVLRYSVETPHGMSMDAGVGYLYRVAFFEGFQEDVDYITKLNPEYLNTFIQDIFGYLPDLNRQDAWEYAENLRKQTQLTDDSIVEFRYDGTFNK